MPENHLAWTVIGAGDQMDLARFRDAYPFGAASRAPLDPAMMVALLFECICAWDQIVAGDRAGVPGGRRV